MFNLQGSEIIVILLLALVVLGPEKLPDAIRKFAQTYGELKKMGTGFQSELKSALDEPMREMKETARMVQDAADPQKIAAQADEDSALREAAKAADRAGLTDVPITAAALEVTDPAYEADDADGTRGVDIDDHSDGLAADVDAPEAPGKSPVAPTDPWAAPVDGPVDHAPPVVVNQIAAAHARGPIPPPAPSVRADLAATNGHGAAGEHDEDDQSTLRSADADVAAG